MNPANPSQPSSPAATPGSSRLQLPLREVTPHPTVLWSVCDPPARLYEPYRLLRTRLLHHPLRHSSLVVTSSCPADGKSTVSINLAGVMAKRGQRVLLMDCDLRRSKLSTTLGIRAQCGLDAILQGASPEEMIFSVSSLPNLSILLAGRSEENPVDILDSPEFGALMERLRTEFDYIVIDSPPILNLADFPVLERLCDATVFVVRPGYTEISLLQDSLATLNNDKFLGTVINQNVEWWLWKSSSYYQYYKDYDRSRSNNAV